MSWSEATLGDLVTLRSGGTPSKGNADYWTGDVPWVSSKDMKTLRLFDTQDHISPAAVCKGTRLAEENTILMVVRSMILAKELPISITKRAMAFNQDIKAIIPNSRVENEFLLYLLLAHRGDILGLVDEAGHGTSRIQTDRLLGLSVRVPSPSMQTRISNILSAYDDLIENNTRRIAILEDMARRLFEEWFLAEAKAGCWVDLETLCEGKAGIQTGPFGSQLHKEDYSDEGVPVVMPKNMADMKIREEGIARIPTELAAAMPRHILRDGDVVYGRRGDIGRRAFVTHREDGWFCGTGCLRIRPDRSKISPRYLFDALGVPKTDGAIKGRAHGATMPNLSAGLMKSVPVFLPEKIVQERYAGLVDPLFDMAASLETCNTTLRTTRDLLLPKLISGEIEVRAAEEKLEAAAA